MELTKDYPDIVQLECGQQSVVVLNSYAAIKEAFIQKGDNFIGRMKPFFMEQLQHGPGIISAEGPLWKVHRRFALRTLRDFGFGSNLSEQIVQTEAENLQQFVRKSIENGNSEINIMDLLLRSVSNVICTLAIGEQPGYEDDDFMEVVNRVRQNLSRSFLTAPMFMFRRFFELAAPLVFLSAQSKSTLANLKCISSYLQMRIDAHVSRFNPDQAPIDYIDAFLLEKYKLDKEQDGATTENKEQHSFSDQQLRRELIDLFVAGTDTTSNSLTWGLLFLALNPDVQKRCHDEIDAQIGRERFPCKKDRDNTPYLLAVMDEVQRFASIVPQGVFHRSINDDTLQGYHVPGNTIIVPFVYGAHHDPRVWEKPSEFYPEHFLETTDGDSASVKYKSRDELVPFLIGKRECLGETLAKTELYVFFITLLQRYKVSLPNKERERLDSILLGSDGTIHSPAEHRLHFEIRV
jgi:cytochrome P450